MSNKTAKEMTGEVHQAVLGIEGTEDKGLVGDFKDLLGEFRKMNGRVSRNSRIIFIMVGIFIALGSLGGLEIADVISLFGG